MRDITLGETVYFNFTTRQFSDGVPTVLAGSQALSVLEENNATPITAGVSVEVSRASVVGLNQATIVATGGNGYEAGKGYAVYISTGTVGGVSVVGEVVAQFTVGASAAATDLANGTNGLTALAADIATAQTDLDTLTGSDGATLATAQGNYAPSTVAALATAQTDLDTLTDASGEPAQGAPPVSATDSIKIGWLYKTLRNRKTSTATLVNIYNDDATTVDYKRVTSDDDTTYDEGELVTGP